MKNKLICGDTIEELKKLPDSLVDLIVTSPPYNCNFKYDNWDDNLPWEEYLSWCRTWISECHRVLKDDGRICINVLVEMGVEGNTRRVSPMQEFLMMYQELGIKSMGTGMWLDKTRGKLTAWGSWQSASAPYIYTAYEAVLMGYKKFGKKQTKGEDTISKKDFILGCSASWDFKPETRGLTLACFPVELPKMLVELLSYKGDLVLDPFVGSGTTALAAKHVGRSYYGIDNSQAYIDIAKSRLAGSRNLFDWLEED